MKVLGIESSSLVASVALVTDDILTAEYTVNFKKTHSQTLLPMLDEIVKMLGLDLETIDAIAAAEDRALLPVFVLAQLLQRTGTGIKEASDPCTYSRCYCLQYVGGIRSYLPYYGRKKMPGIYRTLSHGKWYGDRYGAVPYGYGRTDQPVK